MKRKRRSVKTKIIMALISVIVVFGSIATFIVYKTVNNVLASDKEDSYRNLAVEQKYIINQLFDYASLVPAQISSNREIISYLQQSYKIEQDADILKILNDFKFKDVFSTVYLMDAEGNTLVSTDPSFLKNNYSFRDYFKSALINGTGTDTVIGVTSKEPGYYFSSAVRGDNEDVVGVITAKMYTSVVNDMFEGYDIGTVRVIDRTGIVVYSSNIDDLYKSLGTLNEDELKSIRSSRRFSDIPILPLKYNNVQKELPYIKALKTYAINDSANKSNELLVLDKIADYPIYILLSFDHSEFMATSRNIAMIIALLVALAAVSAAIVVSILLSRFLKPLESLKKVAQLISQGFYTERVPIESNDEFASVGEAINAMLNDIQHSNEMTEKQVKEQTKQIKVQNDDLAEQQLALLNLLEDIEEEKAISDLQAQDLNKFRMAVENASDHIVITDSEGIIIYINKAVTENVGFTSSEAAGKKAGSAELWGGNMSREYYENFWKTIKIDKQVFRGEFVNKKKGGAEYTASTTVTPVLSDIGEIMFFIGIQRDVTDAKEVDRMKTEFISLASHQLRTPLSAMKWFLELLISGDAGKLNKEQLEFINNINESNERMIDLVESLLNVSRIESGKIVSDPVPTNLKEVVESLIPELSNKINQNKQKFTISVDGELPLIDIDPKLIRNVYMNLLTNSIKYTPTGGQISVYISKKDNEIVSRISDNGYGIPESEKHRAYQKFFRGKNIVDRVTDGNGLGLYLVKAIVDSSGGKVWFESEENKGTTFWFSLPIKRNVNDIEKQEKENQEID